MKFYIGFEFEFYWYGLRKQLMAELQRHGLLSCVDDVGRDPSLKYHRGLFKGIEVRSKPMDHSVALDFLQRMLEFMQDDERIFTFEDCSLHVNVSHHTFRTEKTFEVFPPVKRVRLALDFDTTKHLYLFSRNHNRYARDTVRHKIRYHAAVKNENTIDVWANDVDFFDHFECISFESLDAIDVPKHEKRVELRCIGNTDYHWFVSDILETIQHFMESMTRALKHPNNYPRVQRKLSRLYANC